MMERYLRGIAGAVVLASLGMAHFHSPYWLIATALIGINLFQPAFTNWCPMMPVLRALGIDENRRR